MAVLLPLVVQTTYQELLEKHQHRPPCRVEGSICSREKSGNTYWAARQRFGDRTRETHIGPDNDTTREIINQIRVEQKRLKIWKEACQQLVSQLRGAGVPTLDMATGKLLSALNRDGMFTQGGVLCGTHAFRLYALELGCLFADALVTTQDVDITADRFVKLAIDDGLTFSQTLEDLGMQPVFGLGDSQPVKWSNENGLELDFLTPRRDKTKSTEKLEGLGVSAQSLPYLDFLTQDPILAVGLYREGILVRIPSPERFAIHKLILASLRKGSHRGKARKDILQATQLIEVLSESRPFELRSAFQEAMETGPKWRKNLSKTLELESEIASILEEL